MDVEFEPGCSFSTGSCCDSVRELAGKPAQHPTNSPWLAARAPLRFASRTGFCVGADAGPWSCFLYFYNVARLLLLLFVEGSNGYQLYCGGTGRPQVRGLVSRIALLLLEVDLA
jgi:hypothetical protein